VADFICSFLERDRMTQRQLNRAIARATGDSLKTITRMGFSVVDPFVAPDNDRPTAFGPNVVDWDQQDAERMSYMPQRMAVA
jgi:hypothetical protein